MIALFFDTETNGIKTWDNPDFQLRCAQLGAILQDTATKRVLAEVNLIVDQHGEPIPSEASAVHGITDELAATFGIAKQLVDGVFARLIKRADVLVAHNIQYDLDVLTDDLSASAEMIRNTDKPTFCTMKGSLYIVKAPLSDKQKAYFTSAGKMPDFPYKVPSLTETHQYFYDKPFEGAHDAMADIRACRDIFFTLLEREYYVIEGSEVVASPALKQLMD